MEATVRSRFLPKLAIALYLFSLASPCALHDSYPEDYYKFGIEILLQGWFGILMGELHWYANLVFFYVIYRAWNHRHVSAKAVLSATLVLSAVTVVFPVLHTNGGRITLSPYLMHTKEVLFGTYIWVACMSLGAVICMIAPGNSLRPTTQTARWRGD